ncbi:TraI domain-containing protein [Klebsiella oxytoca]|uniref:TraI domain-containing protein n=1 Tax=Klebsiella oxytoca TaxID=571 RepID=UPI0039C97C57
MLKSLLKYLPVTSAKTGCVEKAAVMPPSSFHVPEGYHRLMSIPELLTGTRRMQWLQMLWDYSSLPKNLYQQYYLQPLEHCATLMQQFPATENGHHAYLGGMVDHLLETVAYAARLSKNYLLPVGAQPEEQASQGTAWNAVIVYAAMLQSLDKLCHLEVELESGQHWIPVKVMPNEPYRFRFRPVPDAVKAQSLSAMLAWKVIPDEALHWLSSWPEVLNTLSLYLTGFRNESGIINAIVSEAIRASAGMPDLSAESVTSVASVLDSSPLLSAIPEPDIISHNKVNNNANITLVSALDSDLSSETIPIITDATDELLDVMGYNDEEIKSDTISDMEKMGINPGSEFFEWLKKSILEQLIVVNDVNSPVYIVAGHLFVRTPKIFYLFISENKEALSEQSCDWKIVQKQFEKLKLHKRQADGTNVYQSQDMERKKSYNGYLIPVAKVYGAASSPADSSLLIIK